MMEALILRPQPISAQGNGGGEGWGLLSTSSYGNFQAVHDQGQLTLSELYSPALLSLSLAPLPRFRVVNVGDRDRGAWGSYIANVASGMTPLPTRPLLAPPTQFSSLSLAGTNSTYQGGLPRLCSPPHHPAPWEGEQGPYSTNHTFPTATPHPNRPGSRLRGQLTPPWHFPTPLPLPLPPLHGSEGERGVWAQKERDPSPHPRPRPCQPSRSPARGAGGRARRPAHPPPSWPRRPVRRLPGSRRRCRPPPCCVIANRTAGVGPPAGHSSASAALAESRGPNVRPGRTGGWLFWGGGTLLLL